MSFTSTAAVLEAMATRIEALVPFDQSSVDDVFVAHVRPATDSLGSRVVHLTAVSGVRKRGSNITCNVWETQIVVSAYYVDQPEEPGQQTVYQRALRDAEDILADLYLWASQTAGIVRIDPTPGDVDSDGQGEIVATRTIDLQFERT